MSSYEKASGSGKILALCGCQLSYVAEHGTGVLRGEEPGFYGGIRALAQYSGSPIKSASEVGNARRVYVAETGHKEISPAEDTE